MITGFVEKLPPSIICLNLFSGRAFTCRGCTSRTAEESEFVIFSVNGAWYASLTKMTIQANFTFFYCYFFLLRNSPLRTQYEWFCPTQNSAGRISNIFGFFWWNVMQSARWIFVFLAARDLQGAMPHVLTSGLVDVTCVRPPSFTSLIKNRLKRSLNLGTRHNGLATRTLPCEKKQFEVPPWCWLER